VYNARLIHAGAPNKEATGFNVIEADGQMAMAGLKMYGTVLGLIQDSHRDFVEYAGGSRALAHTMLPHRWNKLTSL